MKIEEIHDCEKCHGKIVCISVDKLGNTYCGYCGERVNYGKLLEELKVIKDVLEDDKNKSG
jgi:hypothetical protein